MPTSSTSQATDLPASSGPPHFSPSRREGDFVFVSGQMAFDADWRIVGDTVGEQTGRCLARIEDILAPHGLRLADVVKTTVWLTRVGDFAEFNRSYAAAFEA
jgi:2-iminobutanoate/2-iminopropanoate deaminase